MSNLTKPLLPGLKRLLALAEDLEDGAHELSAYIALFHTQARGARAKIKDTQYTAESVRILPGACEFRLKVLLKELDKFRDLYAAQRLRAFKGEEEDEDE